MTETADLVVIGAGVVGLATALAVRTAHPDARVIVLDKEPAVGAHGSGRNSGVLHAGIYYGADTLKASMCAEGRRRWIKWCGAHGVPVLRCGKLIVARTEAELPILEDLAERGLANGAAVEMLDARAAQQIEPRVRTFERALWSPDTASVDPVQVMTSLARAALDAGVVIRMGTAFVGLDGDHLRTTAGPLSAGCTLNVAGLQADRVASAWGAGARYRILPFKGLYAMGTDRAGPLACHVYPVPEPGFPFLGVHFTLRPSGQVTIGPTALPALGREQYRGLRGVTVGEGARTLVAHGATVLKDRGLRALVGRELPKLSRRRLVRRAQALVQGVRAVDYPSWGRAGIRAQLQDRSTGALMSDFVLERAERSVHLLNAVSPGFTCALPLAQTLAEHVEAS